MDEPHSSVTEVEDHRILVGHSDWTKMLTVIANHVKPLAVVFEVVGTDMVRFPTLHRRQVGIGHHDLFVPATEDSLDPRVLEARYASVTGLRQHVAKGVVAAITGHEHQDVRDIIEEPWTSLVVASVAGTDPSCEQVVNPAVVQQARIEDRSVPRHRAGSDDWSIADPSNEGVAPRFKSVDIIQFQLDTHALYVCTANGSAERGVGRG